MTIKTTVSCVENKYRNLVKYDDRIGATIDTAMWQQRAHSLLASAHRLLHAILNIFIANA